MSTIVRLAVFLSLLLTSLLPARALAQGQCQQLLSQGRYEGTTSVMMDIRGYEGGTLVHHFTVQDTGELVLDVGCTVTGGSYHMNVYRTIWFYGGTRTDCRYTADLTQATGPVVAGTGGLPRMDVRWGQGVVSTSDCSDGGQAPPATWHFSLGAAPQGRTISGDFRITYDDPEGTDYDQMAELFRSQGYQVTLNKGWTLTRKAQPDVQGLTASLRQFFLQGIPVTNRYTATIDWDGSAPGSARFILDGMTPQNMTVSGNTATYDLPLGPIQRVGDIPISVEATLEGRVDRLDNLGPLTIVPRPAWVNVFNFQAQPQSGFVRYAGEYRLPTQPLDAHVDLPTILPYIGGTWGLLPTQLKVPLAANSLGTRETTQITAMGGFGLGRRRFTLNASGNVHGTLTRDALRFESDPLTLSTSGVFFREHIGLLAVVPGASAFFDVPVFGSLLQALNASLGVTADVRGTLAGRGRLGVVGERVGLTEGSFDATVRVSAAAGIETPVAWAMVQGGGNGSLSMQLVPSTRLLACQVLLWFRAGAGALGFHVGPLQAEYPVYTCQTTTGEHLLVTTAPPATLLRTTYGDASREIEERAVTEPLLTNALPETVLATGASLQARPMLATGANGAMAVVWNSVSSRGAADAVTVRLSNGTTWRAPVTLSNAARPAFTPVALFLPTGKLLVAWAEAQVAPDPSGITAAFARSFEIVWAELDPANGQVARQGRVTTDSVMDLAPRLRLAPDGTAWLAWLHSPATDMAGTQASPNRLLAARWTGSGWSLAESAAQNLVGTLSWDVVAASAQQLWVVADGDTDGNLGTAADRELWLYRRSGSGWAAPSRLTTDAITDTSPLLALAPGGQPALAWRHGDEVRGVVGDPTTTAPTVWFDSAAGVGPLLGNGQLLAGAGGTLTLLWPQGTEQGQDLWLSRFDPQARRWSQPAPLFDSAEHRRTPSATLLPNGDIMVGLTAAAVTQQRVDLPGNGQTTVPTVSEAATVRVGRIPAGYIPGSRQWSVFLPLIRR